MFIYKIVIDPNAPKLSETTQGREIAAVLLLKGKVYSQLSR